jgi:hypothetical protein
VWQAIQSDSDRADFLLSATAVGGFFVEMHHHFHPPAPPEQDPPAATALDAQRQNSRYFRQLIALDRSFASKDRAEANRRLDALEAFLPKLIPAYNDRLQFFSEGGMACPGGPASMPCSIGP